MSGLLAVRVVGGIVPPSMLAHLQAGEVEPASLTPGSFHLAGNETLRDAAARAWSYLLGAWSAWHDLDNPATGVTRERWLLPLLRELGYGNVPALSHGLAIGEDHYPISHAWEHVPVHLLGPGAKLDHRNPGVAGAARAPQAMLQEYLNRSDDHLWSILTNGTQLRLVRDSTALAGSAYLEFDLEAIFTGELYAEFLLMFLVAHSSRLEKRGGDESGPTDCWLESWRNEAVDSGTRALDRLRDGVERALTDLGDGFLHHPNNGWLVAALRNGDLSDRDYLRALLRLVYRLLFCFVAEDRDALLDPSDEAAAARQRYADWFATVRVRRLSRLRAGGPHPDLWRAQRLVLGALGGDGLPQVGVPALGGLFDPDPRSRPVPGQPGPDLLLRADLANSAWLSAVRALAWVEVSGGRLQPVDYRNLGAEELGSVYESLLELVPRVDLADMTFRLETSAGNDRKTTGSYYTPPALVSALLDTALDPLLDDAVKSADSPEHAEARLLALTVCDPASGSGGFLVAAARRIARRVAQVRSGEDEPTPPIVQHALRDVVGRCIYGVDMNDLAAELAKVSLWLEALEPGKPLGFLDARIRVGNSLLGTTPALLADGIPDQAFKEIGGDDKKYAAAIRKQNKAERSGQSSLFDLDEAGSTNDLLAGRRAVLAPTDDVTTARRQAERWQEYEESVSVRGARVHADAWCAAFVWPLQPGAVPPVTQDTLQALAADPDPPGLTDTVAEVERLAKEYRFFHWHLEFPEVFGDPDDPDAGPDGWPGGFSCLLGNPPWEHIELKEQEYFASRSPKIAAASGNARKRLIAGLATADPVLDAAYRHDKRHIDAMRHFAADSGRYPLNGRGRVKTDTIFAELWRGLTEPHGRSGVIVPTGIATDATTQYFFKDLVATSALAELYDFENRRPDGSKWFENVDSRQKFCLLTVAGRAEREDAASFAFFLHDPNQIDTARFALTPEEITLLNPNTGTCPVFRTRRDAEITLGIYRRVPVLVNEAKVAAGDPDGNPWGVSFMQGLFNMTTDSHLFRTREWLESDGWTLVGNVFERYLDTTTGAVIPADQIDPALIAAERERERERESGAPQRIRIERMMPLYEAKMIHHYDHRWATYDGSTDSKGNPAARDVTVAEKRDPWFAALPRYWAPEAEVDSRLGDRWNRQWLMGWRDIARSTDLRTCLAGSVPLAGVGDKFLLACPKDTNAPLLPPVWSSFGCDFAARQKLGGTSFKFFTMRQVPTWDPRALNVKSHWDRRVTNANWLQPRILELTYTAWDMTPFAEDLGDTDADGRVNPPFVWDDERRFRLRAELDAAFFHLYGINRDDVDYILDTFPIVRRKDEATHGEYRTKRVILELYDALQRSIDTGDSFESPLDPPPGQGLRHPAKEPAR